MKYLYVYIEIWWIKKDINYIFIKYILYFGFWIIGIKLFLGWARWLGFSGLF